MILWDLMRENLSSGFWTNFDSVTESNYNMKCCAFILFSEGLTKVLHDQTVQMPWLFACIKIRFSRDKTHIRYEWDGITPDLCRV